MEDGEIEDGGWRVKSKVKGQKSEVRNVELKLKIEIMAEVKVKGQKSEMVNGEW